MKNFARFVKNESIVCFDNKQIALAFNVRTLNDDFMNAINEINTLLNSGFNEKLTAQQKELSHRLNCFVTVSYKRVASGVFNVCFTFDKARCKKDDSKLFDENSEIFKHNFADLLIFASHYARCEMSN